jgi:hypothetical protein
MTPLFCREIKINQSIDEDGAYAARMDDWVAWEAMDGIAPRGEG